MMIAKKNKNEISAKILKRKKINAFIIRITPKTNQHMYRVGGSSYRERHRILVAILDFVEKAEKHKRKIYTANFLGPNPSRGVWLLPNFDDGQNEQN